MDFSKLSENHRTTVSLYRCSCHHCDGAENDLRQLCVRYGAEFNVEHVEKTPALKDWAGWKTPAVYVNGKQVSQFKVDLKGWEAAIKQNVRFAPSVVIGEVVCMKCFLENEERGKSHAPCAKECVSKGMPMGLFVLDTKEMFVLIPSSGSNETDRLKECVGDEVKITGDICRRGDSKAIVVRTISRPE